MPAKDAACLYLAGAGRNAASANPSQFQDYYPHPMAGLIAERIAEMRKEIAYIQTLNKMEPGTQGHNSDVRDNGSRDAGPEIKPYDPPV